VKPAAPLREYQERGILYAIKNPYSILAMDPGLGKAQKNTSRVYTPKGPVPIASLSVGDIVLGQNGEHRRVLGVYPQGVKDIFKISFNDGSSTHCCKEHLWSVQNGNQKARGLGFKVLDTASIQSTLKERGGKLRWVIPQLSSPASFSDRDLIIPPYLMGVLIGDGSLRRGVTLTNRSPFIYKRIVKCADGYTVKRVSSGNSFTISILGRDKNNRNPMFSEIKRLGLDVLSKHKFVPDQYKYGSFTSRLDILTGILDTDGYVMSDGTLQFTSASERLVDDVREIVESFGGVARKRFKRARCQTGIFNSWTITISMPCGMVPLSKPFKRKRFKEKTKYLPRRRVASIESAGRHEATCISVEGGHYLTDHFIVTHNTRIAIELRERLGGNCLVICPAYLIANWEAEIRLWAPPDRVVTAVKKGKDLYDVFDSDYVLVSYDLCQKSEHLFEWADMVIMDEAHLAKSMKAKRTQFIHKNVYENSIKRIHLLTGTPIKNRTQEFYSLLSLCSYCPDTPDSRFLDAYPDEITFADKFSYREEYTIEVGGRHVTILKWSGLKNVEELKTYLDGKYLRIKSSDVLDLPQVVFKDVILSSEPDHALLKAFKEYIETYSERFDPTVKAVSALSKTPSTIKYVQNLIEETGCALVYTDHVLASETLARGLGTVAINGNMPAHKRMEAVNNFQAGQGTVLVATIGSLSTGVNLTRSNHIVLNDLPWVPGDLKQTIYRIQRLGQKNSCFVHRIFSSSTDEYIAEVLLSKQETIDMAT